MDVGKLPGIVTQKSLQKKPLFCECLRENKNIFENILGVTLGPRYTIDS